jgi:GAF domain-containing protein
MPIPTPELRSLLAAEAERALRRLPAGSVAISRWQRDTDCLHTLVNVGRLLAGEESFPGDEQYPLDTFPAVAALLRFGRPYLDPGDVASLAVLAQMGYHSQAAVPVIVEGRVWGELWAATGAPDRHLTVDDIFALAILADGGGRVLAAHGEG